MAILSLPKTTQSISTSNAPTYVNTLKYEYTRTKTNFYLLSIRDL